mmetsp:Transcript_17410/g.25361  ORF Transcript_17410/g.25361 Transcript_17410/m.25361 type:complete len:276 (-) Transcript_17410:68-895(-)
MLIRASLIIIILLILLLLLLRIAFADKLLICFVASERTRSDQIYYIIMCDGLLVQEQVGHFFHLGLFFRDQLNSLCIGLIDDFPRFFVHCFGGGVRVWFITRHSIGIFRKCELSNPRVHSIHLNGAVDEVCDATQVVGSTGGNLAKEYFFCRTTRQGHHHNVHDLLFCPEEHLLGQILRITECSAASRDDGNLEERIGMFQEPSSNGMACFMVCDNTLFFLAHNLSTLQSTNDTIRSFFKIVHRDGITLPPRRDDGAFVTNVGNISTCETGCEAS